MDQEIKHQLEEIHALTKDNHRLLRTVRRHQLIEMFGKWVFYIVLLLGGGYLFVQYLQPMISAGVTPGSPFEKLIDSYRAK
jgi:hypothetical protein